MGMRQSLSFYLRRADIESEYADVWTELGMTAGRRGEAITKLLMEKSADMESSVPSMGRPQQT